jgi:cytochrome c
MQGAAFFFSRAALAAACAIAAAGPVLAQDVNAGKAAYAQCAACHSTDGSNGAGPSLKGIADRKAGSFPGFRFSRAMKGAGFNWDAKHLEAYLAQPQTAVPGNTMPFSGIPSEKDRKDLIAYLATLK